MSISGNPIKITGQLVLTVFDLLAKAPVLCAKQFNGEMECSYCLNPGVLLSNDARIFLPQSYPHRTYDSVSSYSSYFY